MPVKLKLNKTQLAFIWTMGILLLLEFISMIVLLYFARFAIFFSYFLTILQFLTPLFLIGYGVFLVVMLFSKGKEFALKFWKAYLLESLRFFIVSFLLALALLTCCTLLGTLLAYVFAQVYGVPSVQGVIESLRRWVSNSFY